MTPINKQQIQRRKVFGNFGIDLTQNGNSELTASVSSDSKWFHVIDFESVLTSFRVHNVKKFDNTGEDLEDLISIGTIGLIKAIESFQTGKGTKLATFAARCIENEILMHLRSLKKSRKDVSLHDSIGIDKEGNEITLTLIDILGTEADDVVDRVQLKIEKSKIYRNLDILDEREQEVIRGRFGLDHGGDERTQREIAKELGISRSYVSRIEKRALMKLYHEFYKAKK